MGISVLFVKIFPFASNAITWWLFVWVMPDMNSSLWVNTFVREEPLPLSFYPLLITPSNVLFPEPGSPINSSLISNLTPCCGSLVTMSSTMFPLSPSAAITTVTLACILLASVHIVFNDSYIYYLSKPVGLPSSSTPMRQYAYPCPSLTLNFICVAKCSIRSRVGLTSLSLYQILPQSSYFQKDLTITFLFFLATFLFSGYINSIKSSRFISVSSASIILLCTLITKGNSNS